MKVLFLTGMYPTPEYPQKGIFSHEQVKALRQLNIDVDVVVCLPFYEREAHVDCWEMDGISIQYLRFFKLPRTYDFHRTGINLYWSLRRKIKLSQYDVIHADAALPTGFAAMLASQSYHIPYIVHGHGLDVFLGESYQNYLNCGKIVHACETVFQNASAVIGVSRKVLDKIEARVSLREKGFIAYNGVDVNEFVPIDHSNVITRFISVGNLIPLKGHEYTLRAIRALIDRGYTHLHLDIVGRGWLEEQLKQLVVMLDIAPYVTFHGYVPYLEVRDLMQVSDVFVLPSYYEALGCVYLEAMACCLPIIGCFGNGIDEICENGKQGFLVENKSQAQLNNAMEQLLDLRISKKMGAAARALVVSKYSWLNSAEAVISVYNHVCRSEENGI